MTTTRVPVPMCGGTMMRPPFDRIVGLYDDDAVGGNILRIFVSMNTSLQRALHRVGAWPDDRQAEAAELLVALEALGQEPIEVDEDTLAVLDQSVAQVERGDLADPRQVDALFARFR